MNDEKQYITVTEDGEDVIASLTDGRIAVVENYAQIGEPRMMKIDGILLILCTQGEAEVELSGRKVRAEAGEMVIAMREAVVCQAKVSRDFRFKCVFMSVDYAFRILPTSVRSLNFRMYFEANPTIRLTDEGVETFSMYHGLLRRALLKTDEQYRAMIIDGLMQAFVYELRSLLARHAEIRERPMNAAETIFNSFVALLDKTEKRKQSVKYYADRLNITPKYLSVVCGQVIGRAANDVIKTYVLKDIERLLGNSSLTVKEVSNELGFPNTSFFGRYVKRCYGCTPVELRRKLNSVEV